VALSRREFIKGVAIAAGATVGILGNFNFVRNLFAETGRNSIISSIDIPVSSFFWMLRAWKEGTLVTVDGRARFSEMSFIGRNRVRIRSLVNFPQMPLDGILSAYPEHDLIISKSARRFHVAYLAAGRTKSFVPYLTGHNELIPILLDAEEGLLAFQYLTNVRGRRNFTVVYNFKEDRIIGELDEPEDDMRLEILFNSENLIASTSHISLSLDVYFYNWRTGERTTNELTKKISELGLRSIILYRHININIQRRFLFVRFSDVRNRIFQWIKVTWDEEFTNVRTIPLNYLVPRDRWLNNFFLSRCGTWATNLMSGYRGLRNESLVKRVFFHLDGRYPNGISMH
jgi:hypothetical protein